MPVTRLVKAAPIGTEPQIFEIERRHNVIRQRDAIGSVVGKPIIEATFKTASGAKRSFTAQLTARLREGFSHAGGGMMESLFTPAYDKLVTKVEVKTRPRKKAVVNPLGGTAAVAAKVSVPFEEDEKPSSGTVPSVPASAASVPSEPEMPTEPVEEVAMASQPAKRHVSLPQEMFYEDGKRLVLIGRKEIHTTWFVVAVEGEGEEALREAVERVEDGGGFDLRTDYIDALGSWCWSKSDITDKKFDRARFDRFLDARISDEVEMVREMKKRETPASPWGKKKPKKALPKTLHVAAIAGRTRPYDVKEQLKRKLGFKWDSDMKRWVSRCMSHERERLEMEVENLGLRLIDIEPPKAAEDDF